MDRTFRRGRRRGGGALSAAGNAAMSDLGFGALNAFASQFPTVQDAFASHGRGVPPNEVAVRKDGPIYGGPPLGDAWGGVLDRSRYALPKSLNDNICTAGNPMQSPTKVLARPVEPTMEGTAFTRAYSPFRARHEQMCEQQQHGMVTRTFQPGLEQQLKVSGSTIAQRGSGPGSLR